MHDSAQFVILLLSGEYVTPAGDSTPDIYRAETFDSSIEARACAAELFQCDEHFEVVTR